MFIDVPSCLCRRLYSKLWGWMRMTTSSAWPECFSGPGRWDLLKTCSIPPSLYLIMVLFPQRKTIDSEAKHISHSGCRGEVRWGFFERTTANRWGFYFSTRWIIHHIWVRHGFQGGLCRRACACCRGSRYTLCRTNCNSDTVDLAPRNKLIRSSSVGWTWLLSLLCMSLWKHQGCDGGSGGDDAPPG